MMWKWLRRDRRVALIFVADIILLGLVIGAIALLLGPRSPEKTLPDGNPPGISVSPGATPVKTFLALDEVTPSPAPPTVNPTQLVVLPNQGQNDAPPPPPAPIAQGTAVPGGSQLPPLTPTPTKR